MSRNDPKDRLVDTSASQAVRIQAANDLMAADLPAERKVEILLATIRDPNGTVALTCAELLAELPCGSVIPTLVSELTASQWPSVRGALLIALSRYQSNDIEDLCRASLRSEDAIERESAVASLDRLGSDRAISILVDEWNSSAESGTGKESVAYALAFAGLATVSEFLRNRLDEYLSHSQGDNSSALSVAAALAVLGDEKGLRVLADVQNLNADDRTLAEVSRRLLRIDDAMGRTGIESALAKYATARLGR